MTTGMDTDIDNTSDARKTAIINNETLCLKVDIAALQETRLACQSSTKEKYFMFFWHGKSVGNMVLALLSRICFYSMWKLIWWQCSTLSLQPKKGTATLVILYAHTLYAYGQVKYVFYSKTNFIVSKLPKHDQLVIFGDFNARLVLIMTLGLLV